jgi:hypothetical protein
MSLFLQIYVLNSPVSNCDLYRKSIPLFMGFFKFDMLFFIGAKKNMIINKKERKKMYLYFIGLIVIPLKFGLIYHILLLSNIG